MKTHDFNEKEIKIFNGVLKLAESGAVIKDLKVQTIAEACEMGKGTLYEYFRSKDEILKQTVVYCIVNELEKMGHLFSATDSYESLLSAQFEYMKDLVKRRISSYLIVSMGINDAKLLANESDLPLKEAIDFISLLLKKQYEMGIASGKVSENCSFDFFKYFMIEISLGFCKNLLINQTKSSMLSKFGPSNDKLEDYTRCILSKAFV